jgi:haloalkane dehalogenase
MVAWLKQYHPEIKVVLGGYGTAVFKESFETSDKLKALADYICYGEGLGFLNRIIEKKWGIKNEKALSQDFLPAINSFFRSRIPIFRQIVVVGGLGCVYGCSFCSTSSQFNKHYIPLFTGKQLFNSILTQARKHPDIPSAIIYDEDFLLNRQAVLEFMEYFSNSELQKRPFLLTIFASVQSVLNYTIEELIKCGIGTIFIGVESLNDEVLKQEGLPKRFGNVEALFDNLHAHGINTLGSLIVGWDSQNKATALKDSERFVSMNPTFYQVVPLHVVPGTKLWDQMKAEERIDIDYKVEYDGITDFNFVSKSFSHKEALKIVFDTYSGLVKEGGPWPFRLFENLLKGYILLKSKKDIVFFQRAKIYRAMLWPLSLMAFSSRLFFYGKEFRKRWLVSMNLFWDIFPFLFFITVILSPLVIFVLILIYSISALIYWINPLGDQPDFIKTTYSKSLVSDK